MLATHTWRLVQSQQPFSNASFAASNAKSQCRPRAPNPRPSAQPSLMSVCYNPCRVWQQPLQSSATTAAKPFLVAGSRAAWRVCRKRLRPPLWAVLPCRVQVRASAHTHPHPSTPTHNVGIARNIGIGIGRNTLNLFSPVRTLAHHAVGSHNAPHYSCDV
jgi:hypothetical protein